ncbi:MAG: diphthine synthase [Candidatus Thermoplasmatota archaeon]|jgi:diphthine synthase|nr:diphthine synthase [Candidatus Thermoplasmatota archaeon]MCL5785631.1 diphthine synthase [Candidatus Thermoplasmatota archaeon]
MLRIVGLGIRGFQGIPLDAISAIQNSDHVYLDSYTSVMDETFVIGLNRKFSSIKIADRNSLEDDTAILDQASREDVAIVVVGDPLSATTHNQIRYDALRRGIPVEIIPASSIITYAPAIAGLYPYRMGPPVSIPFTSEKFFPTSAYRKIRKNLEMDLHTLLLLDLREGRTMPLDEVSFTLREMEKREGGKLLGRMEVLVISAAGSAEERIYRGNLKQVSKLGNVSPCSLIIPSKLSDQEKEFVEAFSHPIEGT